MASEAVTVDSSVNLKVNELLKEVQLDYSSANTTIIDNVVSSIKDAINKIPEDFQVTADVAPGFVRDVKADKVDFKFKRPNSIEIGGSYAIQCVTKPDVNVDLFLQLPKECFHEKDYLNYRYHAKRFLYLCTLKNHLKLPSIVQEIKWSTFQNEARKPMLVIHPVASLSDKTKFVIRIIPTASSVFSAEKSKNKLILESEDKSNLEHKLNLERNNIHLNEEGDISEPTPRYNTSILEDMFLEDNAEFINKVFFGWKEIKDALTLLKVWARQRSSIYAHDCLSGFLISVIMAYLSTKAGKNRLNNSMTTLQIFRVTLDFIANSKLWDSGLLFKVEKANSILKEDRRKYFQSFPVVISDPFGDYNFAFRMSKNGFMELRNEAALALNCINKCTDGGFYELFMSKIDLPAKYDYCIRVNLKGHGEVFKGGICLDNECWRTYEQKVLSLMDKALTGRSKFIRVLWRNTGSDCNFENGLLMLNEEPLLIGISIISVEEAFKQSIMGPSPEEKDKALEFRKFWGDKAELRWFRDGKITETAVWEHKEWEKHLIIKDITQHILSRHISLAKENIKCFVDQLDFSLLHENTDPISFASSLLKAYDDLSKRLRGLNDIPLTISSVQPLDSAFRLTSVYPPSPHPLAFEKDVKNMKLQKFTSTCIQPLEVVIQLEGSGNWPMDDDVALEKTKTAFLLKIGDSLEKSCKMTCTATENDVDVFMSGYAFRLKILHERGLSLIKQAGNGHVKRVLSTDKELFIRSQQSSMVNGLRGRYPIYGPVVRLAKRWVSAHFFSNMLKDEAIELLVAHLFLKPLPFDPPYSRINGFLRFLRLLAEYDWMFSALIVDINGDMSPDDEKEINENFALSRKGFEDKMNIVKPAMFLATFYDKASEAWTGSSPTTTELKRLSAYASSSANVLTKLVLQNQYDSYKWECLFRTPLNNYDAVILLHRDKLSYPRHLLFPSEFNQGRHVVRGKGSKSFHPYLSQADMKRNMEELRSKLMVNFDPIKCLISDIERDFPDMFKVWYDSLGGDAVGLTWDKTSLKKREREDSNDEEESMIDTLRAVGEVGKGFVRSVYCVKAPKLS